MNFLTHNIPLYRPNIKPSLDWLPDGVSDMFDDATSAVAGVGIAIGVIGFVVAAIMFGVGQWGSGGTQMRGNGIKGVIASLAVLFLIGGVSVFTDWGLNLGGSLG